VNLVQVRVDDRLIHGQVVIGCCGPLAVRRLILAHDAIAADPFQAGIYLSSVPEEVEAEVLDLSTTAARLRELDAGGDGVATMVVVADPAALRILVEAGAPVVTATLGGLHARDDRTRELTPGQWVSAADVGHLRAVVARGVDLQAQTVPGTDCATVDQAVLDRLP